MAEDSAIPWCDHTHNPWWGCDDPLSPACINCYARAWAKRCGHDVFGPPETTPRRELSDANWAKPLKWNREALQRFGRRARVFHGSMCDLFEDHPQLPPLREREWDLIEATPNLEHLLLTKRIENVKSMVPERWIREGFPDNVRIGTTVENQPMAERRIPELLKIPAPNFLSMEPLLGPVDLEGWMFSFCRAEVGECGRQRGKGFCPDCLPGKQTFDQIIIGFESGAGARSGDLAWMRDLLAKCRAAGTAAFTKQLGPRPMDASRLKWFHHSFEDIHLHLDDRHVATVWRNGTWHTWDEEGTGGENDIAATVEDAKREAHAAVIRQGWHWYKLKDKKGADPSEWPEDLRVQQFPETPAPEEADHGSS